MTPLASALALAERGWKVFPVAPDKRPLTAHGLYDGTDDAETIATWWSVDHPDALIGVWTGASGIVALDLDVKPGIDGTASISGSGLSWAPTMSYQTLSGSGLHHVFSDPTPELSTGLVQFRDLPGVDVRGGNSYIVWRGDDPNAALATAPKWLRDTRPEPATGDAFSGDLADWLALCPTGDPDLTIERYLRSFPSSDIDHGALLDATAALVRFAIEGHPGVPDALRRFRDVYLAAEYDSPRWRRDFDNALSGAIQKFGGFPTRTDDAVPSEYDRRVAERAESLRINRDAQALLSADEFAAVDIPLASVSDIRDRPRARWHVDGIVPESALCLVAGPPGVGKSFLALGLSLSIAAGIPFLGRNVRPGRVLYVAGEGMSGFPARVESFERYNAVTVPPEAFMMADTGVNLSNEASVKRLAGIIERECFDVVVLDTFRKLSAVADENDAALVTEVFRNALRLREAHPGCTVIIVHHSNKSGDVNGSLAFQSEPDVIWVASGDDRAFKLSSFTEDHGKIKDGQPERIGGLALHSVGESAVVVQGDAGFNMDPLLGLSGGTEYRTAELVEHITTHCNVSKRTAERTVGNLRDSGRLIAKRQGVYARSEVSAMAEPPNSVFVAEAA